MRRVSLAFSVLLVGCLAASEVPVRTEERTFHPDAPPIAPFDARTIYTATERAVSRNHLSLCSSADSFESDLVVVFRGTRVPSPRRSEFVGAPLP